jgi:hypothetical protein
MQSCSRFASSVACSRGFILARCFAHPPPLTMANPAVAALQLQRVQSFQSWVLVIGRNGRRFYRSMDDASNGMNDIELNYEAAESYFAQRWYTSVRVGLPPEWNVAFQPISSLNSKQAINMLAVHYLPWFEQFAEKHGCGRCKSLSYLGGVGSTETDTGEDLGNKYYWVAVRCALLEREDLGLHRLYYVESCTSLKKAGDIIETMLGLVWDIEHRNPEAKVERKCLDMRAYLEAAVLGVRQELLDRCPTLWDQHEMLKIVRRCPGHNVSLPEAQTRALARQYREELEYKRVVQNRDRLRLSLNQHGILGRGLVYSMLRSFLAGDQAGAAL